MFTKSLNIPQFEYQYQVREYLDGIQVIFKLDNGYGISAVNHSYSYSDQDTYEVAVLRFNSDNDWEICYNTPITDDVLCYCSPETIEETLKSLNNL